MPRATLKSRIDTAIARGLYTKPPRVPMGLPERARSEALRAQARRDANHFAAEKARADALQKQLDVTKHLAGIPRKQHEIPVYRPTGGSSIPVLMLSDLHAEERIRPGDVAGSTNQYNPEIFRKRLRSVFQRALFLVQTMRHMGKIDTMVVWLGGDFISGFIHEDLLEANHMSPLNACELVREEICNGLDFLLKNGDFKKIILPCNFGNHGRTTEKSRVQTGADNSFEVHLYRQLAREYRNDQRMDFHIANGYHLLLELNGVRVRFHHGDYVNYGGGVGGVTIPLIKAIHGWNSIQHADLDVIGHFHSFCDGGNFMVNGSLCGFGAYSLKVKARMEPPCQGLFFIDSKRGKSATFKVFAE
jgi:hypothetical protein